MPASKSIHLFKGNINPADVKHRVKAEEESKSGKPMKPSELVKNDKFALKEFKKVKEIYSAIKQDDAIHENVISRYCLLMSEEKDWISQKNKTEKVINKLQEEYLSDKINANDYFTNSEKTLKVFFNCERELKAIRKMLLDLEKSSCLTLSDRLRAIPKKAEENPRKTNMEKLLDKRGK